jgi:tRNA threonylcarbamoyl adenosine modification protein YeaZ
MAKGQAEHLMPMLLELCASEGVTLQDLNAIAVCTGPGNFTGIRIAVSAARGLALGLGIPAIGVTAFEARAHGQPRPFTATVPAPRGMAYVQVFDQTGTSDPRQVTVAEDGHQAFSTEDLISNIAQIGASKLGATHARPVPLYVRGADAAPPRDPAPVLLS